MIQTFRKKTPDVIEAIQFDGDNMQAIANAFPDMSYSTMGGVFKILNLDGEHTPSPGDWIIKAANDEFYPCTPDVFTATYEAV